MAEMTMRERMLAVVRGHEHDRVPFVQYSGLAAPDEEVWQVLGREQMGLLRWTSLYRLHTPHCHIEAEDIQRGTRKGLRRRLVTPAGELTQERLINPTLHTPVTATQFVKSPGDYHALLAYLRDAEVVADLEGYFETVRDMGERGLPHTVVGRTPYQALWVEWVSIQDLIEHLVEAEELMDEVFTTLAQIQRRVFEVVTEAVVEAADVGAPVPYVTFCDNIEASAIGEHFFRTFAVPAYDELAGMLDETGLDVPVFVHMDGDLMPLWDAIAESRVRGVDSFSPPPDHDTPVAEAVSRWPDMRLLVNFPSSMHLAGARQVYATTMEMLEQGGTSGRLQIQVSEIVPPGAWAVSFPAIVKAIHDFGRVRAT